MPSLLLTDAKVATLKTAIAAKKAPFAATYNSIAAAAPAAQTAPMHLYPGLITGDPHFFDNYIGTDGKTVVALGLDYRLRGTVASHDRAAAIFEAWSKNIPTSWVQNSSQGNTGQIMGIGGFCFGWTASLVNYMSSTVKAWFAKYIAAEKTHLIGYLDQQAYSHAAGARTAYWWTTALKQDARAYPAGGDFSALMQGTMLTMAYAIGDQATIDWLFDPTNKYGIPVCVKFALQPDNDGDGLGMKPWPQCHVVKYNRGGLHGAIVYSLYNTRLWQILYDIGVQIGKVQAGAWDTWFARTWHVLGTYLDPGKVAPFDPVHEVPDLAGVVSLSRMRAVFGLKYGDPHLLAACKLGGPVYSDGQWVGKAVNLLYWPL